MQVPVLICQPYIVLTDVILIMQKQFSNAKYAGEVSSNWLNFPNKYKTFSDCTKIPLFHVFLFQHSVSIGTIANEWQWFWGYWKTNPMELSCNYCKVLLFSATLKVWEIKVVLLLTILASKQWYSWFVILTSVPSWLKSPGSKVPDP